MAENGVLTNTIQSQVTEQIEQGGVDVLSMFLRAGELIPPWWSRARDIELSRFWPRIDHVASAFSMFASKTTSIPIRVVPKDMSIKAHVKQADYYNAIIIDGADFGNGWHASLGPKFIMDFITQDNGAFIEVIGDAPATRDLATGKLRKDYSKPLIGPALGFAHLDSQRCERKGNQEYPVVYSDIDGSRYRLHHTRVMFASSMPSARARMYGVGYCALTRMINTAQHLLDLATSEQEELGSRPKRRLIVAEQGITGKDIASAFEQADIVMDNQGLSRYSRSVIIAPKVAATSNNPIKITLHDLNLAMTGEVKEKSITLGMFLIALALNIPPRWLWPASSSGATKADAMFQHVAGMGGGIGHLLQVFKQMLGGDTLATAFGKPIPSHLQVIFDYQDDEQDKQQADIRETRSKVYSANIGSRVWDERVARLHALDTGDLTEQEFDDLELNDGRLPDGQDVLNLFLTTEPTLIGMLAISVGDVLNVGANDAETVLEAIEDKLIEVRAILANPQRPKEFDLGKQALAALQALKALYEGAKMQAQIAEGMAQEVTPLEGDTEEVGGDPDTAETDKAPPDKQDEGPGNQQV